MRSLRSEIDDTDLIIHILNNLTPEYDNVVENIENRLGEDYNKIELDEVRQTLRTKYQRSNAMRNKFETEDGEELTEDVAFLAKFKKRFKGRWYVCGNIGHKGYECPSRSKNKRTESNRFNKKPIC